MANPRSVKYPRTKNGKPKREKGTKKCAECGFYFVPTGAKYEFPVMDEEEVGWVAITPLSGPLVMTDLEWHKQWKCCPNCGLDGYRRCIGKIHRNNGKSYIKGQGGCDVWGHFSRSELQSSKPYGTSRRVFCRLCGKALGNGRKPLPRPKRSYYGVLLRQMIEDKGSMVGCREFLKKTGTNWRVLEDVFGKPAWKNLCEYCGIAMLRGGPRKMGYNEIRRRRRRCIKAGRKLFDLLGHPFAIEEWNIWDDAPFTSNVIVILFKGCGQYGGWRNFQAKCCGGQVTPSKAERLRGYREKRESERLKRERIILEAENAKIEHFRQLEEFAGKRIVSDKQRIRVESLYNLQKANATRAAKRK